MPSEMLKRADKRLPVHVLKRLETAEDTAKLNYERINEKLAPHRAELEKRINAIRNMNDSPKVRLRKLRALADYMGKAIAPHVACKQGCSHCCHQPIAISRLDAEVIGKEIGVKPKPAATGVALKSMEYGYHRPCPFLKQNKCSIYAQRPLTCRTYYSLDTDDLLCQLIPDASVPVPNLDLRQLQALYMELSGPYSLADIRDFFPNGTGK